MIKKLVPLISVLCIFAVLLLDVSLNMMKHSTPSSTTENSNSFVKSDLSMNSNYNSASGNEKTNTKPTTIINDTKIVKEKNTDNKAKKIDIDTVNYLDSLQCIDYRLQTGETLTDIAGRYESTCNLNTTIKIIKIINKIGDENNINSQTIVHIPEYTLKNGKMYTVISGDTWYKIANEYYPEYTTESIMKLLVDINNLPNNDLPLGEKIFMPIL